MDPRLHNVHCKGLLTIPGTLHPVPTSLLALAPDLTVRGRYPLLIGISLQIGRLAAHPPHLLEGPTEADTKCIQPPPAPATFYIMQMAAGGSLIRDAHKMRLSRLHKMRGHGREQLGLKVCSPRIHADTQARGKWPARNAYGSLLGEKVRTLHAGIPATNTTTSLVPR